MTSNDPWLHTPNPSRIVQLHFKDLIRKFIEEYKGDIPFDENSFTVIDSYVWSNNYGASFDVRVAVATDINEDLLTWNLGDLFSVVTASNRFHSEYEIFEASINNSVHLSYLHKAATKFELVKDNKAKMLLDYKKFDYLNEQFNLETLLYFYLLRKTLTIHN